MAPELKHITVGGATVGIGIESTCYRYGFVHDGLARSRRAAARRHDRHGARRQRARRSLRALPNSYGTLGYILRAKIALHRAGPYVHLHVQKFADVAAYLEAMRVATESPDLQFVEGLFFEDGRYFLMTGRFVDRAPECDDIVRKNVFYRLVETRRDIYLEDLRLHLPLRPRLVLERARDGLLQPVPPLRARAVAQLARSTRSTWR